MDPALVAERHAGDWERLSRLAKKNTLNPHEAEEFLRLYRAASKDLSRIQTVAPDSEISVRLSNIVHRSRTQLTSVPTGAGGALGRFFTISLPAALYRLRWFFVFTFVFFVGISVLTTLWAYHTPGVLPALGSDEMRRQLAERDFKEYYFEHRNEVFAVGVWTNNAWIALQWVALGITGIYVIYGLIVNAVNVGISGAIMFEFDKGGDFFYYILPHGIPEITGILIAAAAGLRICVAWVVPGPELRRTRLAREARTTITVGLGLIIYLFLSGLIEGFITPSELPNVIRMGSGILLTAAIFAYAIYFGRPALKAGLSGDVSSDKAGYSIVATDR